MATLAMTHISCNNDDGQYKVFPSAPSDRYVPLQQRNRAYRPVMSPSWWRNRDMLHAKRRNSPQDFIRYLCQGIALRSKDKMHERAQEDFVTHCIQLWHSQGGVCAVSGVGMTYQAHDWCEKLGYNHTYDHQVASPLQISIDRIDNRLGYTRGNVRLVCLWVQNAMARYSDHLLLYFCRHVNNKQQAC
jgi:hypothetical protein